VSVGKFELSASGSFHYTDIVETYPHRPDLFSRACRPMPACGSRF